MAKIYGFLPPEFRPTDYILGGETKLAADVLCPNGQWDNYLPAKEYQQRNGLETSACVTFGILNCLEVLMKRLYNE